MNFLPTALIGDVIASRDIPQRESFQDQLKNTIQQLNEELSDSLLGHLVLIRGDEMEALLSDPLSALTIVTRLEEALAPHKLTWGIGYGELSTNPANTTASQTTEMDGPCFHKARDAYELARASELWVAARGFGATPDVEITAVFQLLQAIRWRWTTRQTQIVALARERLQKDVAEILGVSPSVVSESLKAAAFPSVLAGEASLRRWFDRCNKQAVQDAPAVDDYATRESA